MFCLDFITSFAAHHVLVSFAPESIASDSRFQYSAACLAGLTSAIVLYPFDLVRKATVPSNQTTFAMSTIPFATCYLGIYFVNRDAESVPSRVKWAVVSSVVGVAVELPFDAAKWGMFRNASRVTTSAVMTTVLRVPLAVGLLLAYDQFGIGIRKSAETQIQWHASDILRNTTNSE
ncbi:hypothetical protein BCR33DRAFT_724200 [Rhizoclosmatium globosum]|uniref:Uncharacterized protein n=1 Tax=Rhizoclosmatium globosum TaxID=329046 RepID=A0A1Y2B740_9FUNG|nr:hypothetical protein BCR33DRAFT_724200 [Rhizoclosmatium globosum]|eukprot:ORY30661.1 hypothetical protein BCR33DRAFT_724200 [Rhizoclosmatium globosum]